MTVQSQIIFQDKQLKSKFKTTQVNAVSQIKSNHKSRQARATLSPTSGQSYLKSCSKSSWVPQLDQVPSPRLSKSWSVFVYVAGPKTLLHFGLRGKPGLSLMTWSQESVVSKLRCQSFLILVSGILSFGAQVWLESKLCDSGTYTVAVLLSWLLFKQRN